MLPTGTTHQFAITYIPGIFEAGWTFNGQTDPPQCTVNTGDTIQVIFPDLAMVGEAMLLSGYQGLQKTPTPSPFRQASPINLLAGNQALTVGSKGGQWGFIIAFSIIDAAGNKSFYCVPDPELQVDSIGGTE